MEPFTLTIDGSGEPGQGAPLPVLNPATETMIAQAPRCDADQLDRTVAAAARAQPGWAALPIAQRQDTLRRAGAAIGANLERLAALLTAEQGKPLNQARGELMGASAWFTRTATLDLPVDITEDSELRRAETRHMPIGVVAAIVPWNFPALLACVKIAPALLAGNAVVVKPSPHTPLTTLAIGALLRDVLPPGVLNVLSGGDELGPMLTAHKGIGKVSFTGSTATGKRVLAGAAVDLKRVTLELGGNDAAIVMPDVDVERVAETLFWSAFNNCGQVCIATKRMFVHAAIYDRLAEALAARARTVRIGNGAEEGVELGPLQNRAQFERVKALIADCHAQGLHFLAGGEVPAEGGTGYFLPVCLVDNPPDDSRVVVEEAFGPILPLLRFDDVEEVITRANASEYGLGGSVWCADVARAGEIAARLKTGTVWINELQNISPFTVFAGHGQSGFGAENGVHGLLEFTNPKTTTFGKVLAVAG